MAEPEPAAPALAAPAAPWPSLRAEEIGPIEKRYTGELRHYKWRWVWPPSFRATDDWRRLRRDVEGHQIRDPLIILADGQVIDGGHRLDLAKEFALNPVPVCVAKLPLPLSEADQLRVETFAVLEAAQRRQVTPLQVTGMLLNLTRGRAEVEARQASLGNLRQGTAPGPGSGHSPTLAKIAEDSGVSVRRVKQIRRIARHGSPELRAKVRSGEVSVRKADWSLRETPKPPAPPTETHTALNEACTAFLARADEELTAAAAWPPDGRTALLCVLRGMERDLRELMELIAQQGAAGGFKGQDTG